MADAKSLYDILVAEKAMLADRRSSPETALLKDTLKSSRKIKWVKSKQMLADRSITMGADTTYLDTVLVEGGWTLGSDHKAPSMRLRAATRKFRSEFGETSEGTSGVYTAYFSSSPVQVAYHVWACCCNAVSACTFTSRVVFGRRFRSLPAAIHVTWCFQPGLHYWPVFFSSTCC